MFAIGETVSGILCVTLSEGLVAGAGLMLLGDGANRMFVTLNNLWTHHERSLLELKKWEKKAIQETR